MLIYYIRHGQSSNNLLFENTGTPLGRSEDPDLSPIGKQQVEYLAEFIRSQIDHCVSRKRVRLYSSPMIRAARTAYAIKKATGLPMSFHPEIYETGGIYLEQEGSNYGKSGADSYFIESTFPGVSLPPFITSSGWYNRPYETRSESRFRALKLAQEIRSISEECEILLLVAHGSFFQDFFAAITGLQVDNKTWFNMNNCAVTCFYLDKNENIEIRYLNRFDFLPSSLIT